MNVNSSAVHRRRASAFGLVGATATRVSAGFSCAEPRSWDCAQGRSSARFIRWRPSRPVGLLHPGCFRITVVSRPITTGRGAQARSGPKRVSGRSGSPTMPVRGPPDQAAVRSGSATDARSRFLAAPNDYHARGRRRLVVPQIPDVLRCHRDRDVEASQRPQALEGSPGADARSCAVVVRLARRGRADDGRRAADDPIRGAGPASLERDETRHAPRAGRSAAAPTSTAAGPTRRLTDTSTTAVDARPAAARYVAFPAAAAQHVDRCRR